MNDRDENIEISHSIQRKLRRWLDTLCIRREGEMNGEEIRAGGRLRLTYLVHVNVCRTAHTLGSSLHAVMLHLELTDTERDFVLTRVERDVGALAARYGGRDALTVALATDN